jgi:uncharacterized membrane protein
MPSPVRIRAPPVLLAVAIVLLLVALPAYKVGAFTATSSAVDISPDGYAQVTTILSFNTSEGAILVRPYAVPDAYSISAVDANNTNVPFSLNGTSIVLNVIVKMSPVTLVYSTALLTAKSGPFWNFNLTLDSTAAVVLPTNATLVTISSLPTDISASSGRIHLTLGNGTWSLVYFIPAPGTSSPPPSNNPSSLTLMYAVAAAAVALAVAAFILVRSRRRPVPLRPDDEKILAYVKSKGGRAYASDIVNSLGMPKSSVWKALRRLEANGLVKTRKEGNRVVVEA